MDRHQYLLPNMLLGFDSDLVNPNTYPSDRAAQVILVLPEV